MKKILYMLMFVLLLGSVHSVITDNLVKHFDFDGDFKDNITGITANSGNPPSFISAFSEHGVFCDGANDQLNLSTYTFLDGDSSFSIAIWFNTSTVPSSNDFMMGKHDGSIGAFQLDYTTGGGGYYRWVHDLDGGDDILSTVFPSGDLNNNLHHFVLSYDGTRAISYRDGVVVGNETASGGQVSSNAGYTLCNYGGGSSLNWKGSVYQVQFFDVGLNDSASKYLYNSGTILNYNDLTGGGTPSPTLTLNSNLINGTINYNYPTLNFTYNGTFTDETSSIVNISFYINDVMNLTLLNVNITNNNIFNITIDGNYEDWLNISFNASNGEVSDSFEHVYYNVDVVQPIIKSDFVNNINYTTGDIVYIYSNYSDANLFAYNITLIDSDDTLIFNYFAENLTNDFYENYSTYTSSYTGNFTILFESWDSHTNNKVKDYKIDYLINGIEIEDNIRIYSDDIKDFTLDKKKDRYSFKIKFNDIGMNVIYLESDNNLMYLRNSDYSLHFINNYENWIDFISDDMYDYEVFQLDNNKYEIHVWVTKKDVTFNSIGDLNYNSLTYNFEVLDEQSLSTILLTSIDNRLNDIYKVISMIPLVLVWIVLTIGGIVLILKGYKQIGMMIYFLSSIFDLIVLAMTYINFNEYTSNSYVGFLVSLAMVMMIPIWLLSRLYIGISIKYKG